MPSGLVKGRALGLRVVGRDEISLLYYLYDFV